MPEELEPTLGAQELALLRYLTDQQKPQTVGEVLEGYGVPQGLSRSTVVTVMERLRGKGYLGRRKVGGIFRYAPVNEQDEVMGGVIHRFIERTLAGSLTPLAAYFAGRQRLSPEEIEEMTRLLTKLDGADTQGKEQPE